MTQKAVFVRLATRPIPRVSRMMHLAQKRNLEPLFIGCAREEGLPREEVWDGFHVSRVGPVQPMLNGRGLLTYITGTLRFNIALFRKLRASRPALVHSSDIETAPACIAYCRLYRVPLVYNIHDNLADRYNLPTQLRLLLNSLEGLCVLLSRVALVPESFRRDALPRWCRRRIQVVRNSPHDVGPTPPRRLSGERVRVLYAGWLDDGRGLAGLLSMATESEYLDVRIAGDGDPAIRRDVEASSATYLGYLDHAAVMAEVAHCDFVAAFYDPSRPINRAAAPNKLAEAFCVGRPVLINQEVVVAQGTEFQNCTIRVMYDEIVDAGAQIAEIASESSGARYASMCSSARQVYEDQYSWGAISGDVNKIFAELGF